MSNVYDKAVNLDVYGLSTYGACPDPSPLDTLEEALKSPREGEYPVYAGGEITTHELFRLTLLELIKECKRNT